jgi:polar amino acid transport system permease protein
LLEPLRGEGSRGAVVATASTILVFLVVAVVVVSSPGWQAVKADFFSWSHMKQALVGSQELGTPSVAKAFLLDIKIFLTAEVLILVFALVLAVVRGLHGPVFFPLRAFAIVYTDVFRGVPLLLVLYLLGFGMPALDLKGLPNSPVFWGIIALTLVYSAYVAEVYRAGIESVHESQVSAARSLGLSRFQSLRFVVLPQAIRRVIPPLLNDFIGLQKDSTLVAVLGPIEAARAAQIYSSQTFNFSSLVVAAMLFILLTIPLARFTDHLVAKDRRKRAAGTGR